MSKSLDDDKIKRRNILVKAALRVAAQQLVTGGVKTLPSSQVKVNGTVFQAGDIVTSNDVVPNDALSDTIVNQKNGTSEKKSLSPIQKLALKAGLRIARKEKEEAMADIFKSAYLKSQK